MIEKGEPKEVVKVEEKKTEDAPAFGGPKMFTNSKKDKKVMADV